MKSSTRINCQLFVFTLDASNVVNLYTLKYVALQDINCGLKEAVSLKSVAQRVYVTENSTLKSSTRINCQLFVSILDASNVVNLYTFKCVALQDINCGLKEAASLKCHAKVLCNWKFNIEKLQLESTVNYLYSYWLDLPL